jgi:hypothetical protein
LREVRKCFRNVCACALKGLVRVVSGVLVWEVRIESNVRTSWV